ncbi:RICIN domain-containing protein [Micromonospora sp. C28ISP2-4]|uniref:RICIN domain-containing protein n=1 Tax=Micromonospora sp. C28ISP2-4 TaxID=3059523 RepID=UPI002676FB8D|nr:RICIN domain-containing protein [Micromonospora sp. C28ISP2-4]MDO3686742.1 RICIN domain-containing protein [Micromonospora sp. C28ISP2-4]
MTARLSRGRGRLSRLLAGMVALLVGGVVVGAVPAPVSAATVDTGAYYVLVNRNSGKALDLYNQATNDGARITQWTRNDGAWQQWQFVDSGGGYYRLRSRHSGKVLDVTGASTANGAAVVQWTDHGGTNQQFRLADSDSGYVRLINRNSNKVMEVQNASTADGGNIVQYDDWNGANQQWQLVRVGDNPGNPGGSFTNPAVWQDFADVDIIRVGDVYYMSASTMHYSPGAPVLRSWDLVNWEFAGHSVPRLDFGSKYDLSSSEHAYVDGIWASTLNYRPSNRTFYWAGCIDFAQTHIYTAAAVDGAWNRLATIPNCYYDAGMLIDDNDTMYVAYGNGTISVAQLSADGRSQVRAQQVYQTPSSIGTLEGARFYKRNGAYYIWLTRPANGQYVLKSTNGPFGPYEQRQVLLNLPGPISGGGVPHQGGLVQTQTGAWYYMAFTDAYPGGRMPTLAPITWTSDGWPQVQTVNGAWGASYPNPLPTRPVKPLTGTDTFSGTTLGVQYEWNHNPDNSRWSVNNGLRLQTASVTNDLYRARNTLTHRIQGPTSTGTIELDYSTMRDGDRAGLAMLRDSSAWIGVRRDNGATRVVMTNGLTMGSNNWNTTSTGTEIAGAAVSGGRIWLRANADIRPGSGRQARFSYSTDGVNFVPLGNALTLNNAWQFFMGYRFGFFNYATQSLGGAVTVRQFSLTTP